MSMMQDVLDFIRVNPGASSADVKVAFPHQSRMSVQRAAYRLFECGYTTRREIKGRFCYFAIQPAGLAASLPADQMCKAANLIVQAEKLEQCGFYQRAATVWFDAFVASKLPPERERCLKRRQICLRKAPCPKTAEAICHLAGRYEG